MLHVGRPFGARLRGVFLIPQPGLPAAAGPILLPAGWIQRAPKHARRQHQPSPPQRSGLKLPYFPPCWKYRPLAPVHLKAGSECGDRRDLASRSINAADEGGREAPALPCIPPGMVRICSTGLQRSRLCGAHLGPWMQGDGDPGSWRPLARTGFRVRQGITPRDNAEERSVRTRLFCWEATDARGGHPIFQLCSHRKWLRGIGFPVSGNIYSGSSKADALRLPFLSGLCL